MWGGVCGCGCVGVCFGHVATFNVLVSVICVLITGF